jgi:hypothetical protein
MKTSLLVGLAALSVALSDAGSVSALSDSEQITAVSSKVHNGYARTRLPDGSFKPETYALAVGGAMIFEKDPTIDNFSFQEISNIIVGPLAGQNYVPSHDLDKIKLLIVVYWGTVFGSRNLSGAPGVVIDSLDLANAKLLGFVSDNVFGAGFGDPSNLHYAIIKRTHGEVMNAIDQNRYFIILLAIDYQAARAKKNVGLLWETRISLSERHHDFGVELPNMAKYAAKYFGQESHGLILKPVPEGRVEIGQPKSLGDVPARSKTDAGQPTGQP